MAGLWFVAMEGVKPTSASSGRRHSRGGAGGISTAGTRGRGRGMGRRVANRLLRAALLLGILAGSSAFLSSCFGIPCLDGNAAAAMCSLAPPEQLIQQISRSAKDGGRWGGGAGGGGGGEPAYHTEDGRVVMMDAQRAKMGVEEFSLLSPLRVSSGDFAEFAEGVMDEWGASGWDISSNIVPFRPQGFGISGPVGGMMSLRLRGGSKQFGANVRHKSPDNATEPDKGHHSSASADVAGGQALARTGSPDYMPSSTTHLREAGAVIPGAARRPRNKAADGGRSLRIALFTWESLHTIAVGGVAPHVTELAAGLERRGHEVHVYSRTGDGQLPYEIVDGVHIHRVPIALDPDFIAECNNMCNSFCWFMRESEEFQGASFDLCHGHDWLAAKAVVQCKNMGRATVATIHSTEYGRCGNVNYGGQSERIRKIEEEVAFVADRVISVSGVLCDEVKLQFGISADKLRMVYNGIHLAPYLGTVDAGVVKARNSIGPLDPVVLFVGRLATQKGPDLLVEAIPLVLASRHDVKFLIVGDGYMKSDLERRVQELGISHAVRFLGSMSGRPLVELFKSADCVCLPSRNEPFGIVVLEAWASGKPVVATSSGGPREFVDHGVDGFHVHPSANSISWGICEIFSNFEKSRRMGLRGRSKASQRFNWDRIAEETERIYRELAGH